MGKKSHATESRDRSFKESICAEKGCKFFGQLAQQGVCHTTSGDLIDWDRLAQHEQREEAELAVFRKKYKGKEYVRWLEAMYLCAQLNWTIASRVASNDAAADAASKAKFSPAKE